MGSNSTLSCIGDAATIPAIPPPRVTGGGSRRQATEVLSTEAVRAKPLVGGLSVSCRGVAPTRRCALLAAALGRLPLCPRIGRRLVDRGPCRVRDGPSPLASRRAHSRPG